MLSDITHKRANELLRCLSEGGTSSSNVILTVNKEDNSIEYKLVSDYKKEELPIPKDIDGFENSMIEVITGKYANENILSYSCNPATNNYDRKSIIKVKKGEKCYISPTNTYTSLDYYIDAEAVSKLNEIRGKDNLNPSN